MPISIDYSPAQTIETMALLAGRGDYNRWAADQQFRNAQAAQQAAQFQQQQAFRENAFIVENQQQQQQAANRNAIMAWQRQNEVADRQQQMGWQDQRLGQQRQWEMNDREQQRQYQLADQTAQRQNQLDFIEARERNDRERMGEAAQLQMTNRSAEEIEKETGDTLAGFSKQREFLTAEGAELLNGFQNEYRQRQKIRNWARPGDYAKTMSDLANEVERADLGRRHFKEPKQIAQEVKEGSHEEKVYAPDGTFMGYRTWTKGMRNGMPSVVPEFTPYKPTPDPAKEWMDKNFQKFQNAEGKIDLNAAMRAYEQIEKWNVSRSGSPEEKAAMAQSEMGARQAESQRVLEEARASGIPLPGAGFNPQMAASAAGLKPEAAYSFESGRMPKHISELPPAQAFELAQRIAHPKTPAEADKLPQGTWFMTPDGRITQRS